MTPDDPPGHFPHTRWTLIARLKSPDAALASRALEELCAQYYYPLYCYIRRRGFDRHDAEDVLHDFFAKLLRLGVFQGAEGSRGHLRSLLSTALQRFLFNRHRDNAHREREVSLDIAPPGEDPERRYCRERFTDTETPERVFDRKWGHELLENVVRRLDQYYTARDRKFFFDTLRPVLLAGGSLRGGDSAQLASTLGMSEGALRVALSRLLGEYRAILENEVLQTVESSAEVDGEIAHLLGVFSAD